MKLISEETFARAYYRIKPFMSRRLQILIRGMVAQQKRKLHRAIWPIDPASGGRPSGFEGWPGGKRFSVVLTHDVDTARGVARCEQLMALEQELGFRSSFNFVVRDYHLPVDLRRRLVEEGFEVGVHGLEHSRKLYESKSIFAEHAKEINEYLKEWGAVGFRSPCVYHNFEWLHGLDISYDASSFDTDPFEPQSDGLGTIFPVSQKIDPLGTIFPVNQIEVPGREYVELPYTLPQDFTMFILFREKNIGIWKQKLRWIAEHGGMALLITHPDYMRFDAAPEFDEYHPDLYRDLLTHIKNEYAGEYWHALPQEMASFWNQSVGGGARPVEVEYPGMPADQEVPAALVEVALGAPGLEAVVVVKKDALDPSRGGIAVPEQAGATGAEKPAQAAVPLPGVAGEAVGLIVEGLTVGDDKPVEKGTGLP
jgi:peptidoglycan/xylan/chitin deacetylase (PgdA/CDA1 family)